ncbi:unnamed protein product, partial [Prorocentrum cordatum]
MALSARRSSAVVAINIVLLVLPLLVLLVTLPSLHLSSHSMMMTNYIRHVAANAVAEQFGELRSELESLVGSTVGATVQSSNKSILDTLESLRIQITAQPKEVDQQIMATVRPHIDSIHRGLQSKIDSLGSHVNTLSIDVERHTSDIANLRKQMEELRGELMVAKRTEKAPTPPPSFDRVEDPSVVVAMATKMVGIESVRATLSPFLSELGLDASSYTIKATGPMPSRKYLISFNGSVGLASKYVNKVLSNLRQNDEWRIFEADVSGATPARLHLGPDKNPKQIKTEMALRKLRTALAGKYDGRWAVDRERGILRCGWTHILKLSAQPDDQPFDIFYNDEGLREVGIAKHE